ncbi:MAG TPA: tetrahydrofolate dehydrogenase/cyclohydrolase catalytic domain-containing protein [Acidimicrobiales bacterium]|jgi:methylenetetrahydrofolate dehydrogenase (NADP+)/methenyltetrahydrofolate cyclohydrolase
MDATIIDGRRLAAELRGRVRGELELARASGASPGLATIRVGDDYAAQAYERRLQRHAEAIGCTFVAEHLPADAVLADVLATVGKLNADPRVTGILVLRPLPPQVPEVALYRILDPAKDIEAVHPANAGLMAHGLPRFVPSTPASCFYVLDHYARSKGEDPSRFLTGKTVVIVGRSHNVGKPAVWLALDRDATVVSCNLQTSEAGRLEHFTRQADVLIVAAGVPGLITGDHVRDGVIAIDVGINPIEDPLTGKVRLVGDLDAESVALKAEALTPVPGGVGPITDIWLVRNAVIAAIALHTDLPFSPLLTG